MISRSKTQVKLCVFQPIRHEKLNQAHNPCDPSPQYSLGRCAEEYVMRRVGCQPPWRKFNVEGLPLCDNWTLLEIYGNESNRIHTDITKETLIRKTKCLPPCSFMEYKFVNKTTYSISPFLDTVFI